MAHPTKAVLLRMFGSAVASQVVLSMASFLAGILLIRRTTEVQYGYYVLIISAVILAVSLQHSFIAPAMVHRLTRLGRTERAELTGGLYREQRRVIVLLAGIAEALTGLLWLRGLLGTELALLVSVSVVAMAAALNREYFRMVLHAHRRASDVFRGDLVYALLLILGILLATATPRPAVFAAAAVVGGAAVAAAVLARSLHRLEPWDSQGAPGILRRIAPLAAWSTAGAAIHWLVSQGYAALAAATLDISAVAAIAATRMLAMPVTVLSLGIGSLMLPVTAQWLIEWDISMVLKRLSWLALALASVAACYFGVLWLLRDWVFETILNTTFVQSDLLLVLWAVTFVLMAGNQQLLWLLIARARFRALTALAAVSAAVALSCSYVSMLHIDGAGAPLGILVGELINTVGIAFLCLREATLGGRARSPVAAAIP